MSTPPLPPEPPTRRLRPADPPPQHVAYEPAVAAVAPAPVAADPGLLYVHLEDAIASLRTALVFVGLIAVLGLGLAVYALTRDDGTPARTTGGGVSDARVTRLDDRVSRLSRQLQALRASARSDAALAQRVDTLSRGMSALRSQSAAGAPAADTTQAIQDLDKRVGDLEQQVQGLTQGQTTP